MQHTVPFRVGKFVSLLGHHYGVVMDGVGVRPVLPHSLGNASVVDKVDPSTLPAACLFKFHSILTAQFYLPRYLRLHSKRAAVRHVLNPPPCPFTLSMRNPGTALLVAVLVGYLFSNGCHMVLQLLGRALA